MVNGGMCADVLRTEDAVNNQQRGTKLRPTLISSDN